MDASLPKKIAAVPCGTDRLDKAWGLTVKSATAEDVTTDRIGTMSVGEMKHLVRVCVTLAFATDASDVKAIRTAFATTPTYYSRGNAVPRVAFYLFDDDSVVLQRVFLDSLEGEVTGVAGDAFRVTLHCDPEIYKKARKIDLRFPSPEM